MNMRPSALIILIALVAASALAQPTDAQIRETIEKRIKGTPVRVTVERGVATLTGTIPSFEQKRRALDMARRTVGVTEVTDRIIVLPSESRTDREILEAVREALSKNLGKNATDKINTAVTGRVVTLTGTLPSSYPKQVAEFLAGLTAGVVGVRNEIVVRPTIARTDAQVAQDVRSRFRRNALIKEQGIEVSVASGVVTLTGTVDTMRQVEQAEAIARFTPGTVDVRNQLFFRS